MWKLIKGFYKLWLHGVFSIFVIRHYLFLKAHSIPQASLSENCSHPGTQVIRRQISVHIFAPNGGYCWIPVSKAAFGHSDASIFILKGYHDYFRTLTPSPPPDPQRWSICLQRRNRRLYDRGSHSFVGSKSTFPCQRIVYVVIKRLHFRIFSDSVFSN